MEQQNSRGALIPPVRFAQLLEQHIGEALKTFSNKSMSPIVLREIRDKIREKLHSVFDRSTHHKLTTPAVEWLANQFFKSIKVSNADETIDMSELVVINEHNLADMPYSDIELLRNLYSFSSAPWATELEEEYNRRSES